MVGRIYRFAGASLLAGIAAAQSSSGSVEATSTGPFGPAEYTVPGAFPTSIYASYYNDPTATTAEPQPVISDPVTHEIYPELLTSPDTITELDTWELHPLNPKASSSELLEYAFQQIISVANGPTFTDTCQACQAGLEVAKFLALAAPEQGPQLAVRLCEYFDFADDCYAEYSIYDLGSPITQVLAYADVGGLDGQMICYKFLDGLCDRAPTSPLNLTNWFAKPKPDPLPTPRKATGQRLKVLHMSDLHIDPRYTIGAEASCSSGLCCRPDAYNDASPNTTVQPAPRFGAYECDSPYPLILAALQSVPVLTDTEHAGFNFTIYTGDLVSHDDSNELSKAYTVYSETVLYDLLKTQINSGPVYAVMGNHDTYNQAQNAPYNLNPQLKDQFNWDYDHLASLWQYEGWISDETAETARTHYSAYSVQRHDGLRIITLNTDMWYGSNYYAYINLNDSDNSGMLRFVTDELQAAEDAGDRAYILGHVLSGWDGTNPLANPTNLFYQIVDRFSPHVIAGIFFGHTHEDQFSIFYANNATNISAENALAVEWIVPSVTPLTNLNSGFRVYEVDSGSFDILDAYTFEADVNSFGALDGTDQGPVFKFEYSAREAYGSTIEWGENDPLNATWWHLVTEAMEADPSLVELFTTYQGKSSVLTASCTGDCVTAKICYMRSGSASIAFQNCATGYGSVQ